MTNFWQFAFLGIGAGAAYVLLAQGATVIYRASGIINFAQAAFAMFGAYAFVEGKQSGWSTWLAFVVAVALTAVLGVVVYGGLIRPLRTAAPLARTIATLGILSMLTAIGTLRYTDSVTQVASLFPTTTITFAGINVPVNQFWLGGIALAGTVLLYAVYRFTRFGRATSAVAEDELSAATLGWSPDVIAGGNWAIGAALAAVAGILIVPLTGLSVSSLALLIVPTLAACLLGSFRSFPLTLVGGLVVGIVQSEASWYVTSAGWPQAAPFIIIIIVLVFRGRMLPLRSHVLDRLPALGSGQVQPARVVALVAVAVVLLATVPLNWANDGTVTFIWAIALLSVVVLTGYAGQLSLAQFVIGGVGALIAARLVTIGWPLPAAAICSIIATIAIGIVLGLPALRTRGANLAVITLALGSAVTAVVFTNASYMGGQTGTSIGPQSLFGIKVDYFLHPRIYGAITLACLVLSGFAVANLRRGSAGRRLIAVRTNERAAAALGIDVMTAKLYAFAVSAGIAGLAGILYGFRGYTVTYADFTPQNSITVVGLAVIGAIAYVSGAPVGAVLAVGGVASIIGNAIFGQNQAQILVLIGGAALNLTLILNPDGIASSTSQSMQRLLARYRWANWLWRGKSATADLDDAPGETGARPQRRPLEASGISVHYGRVAALDNVSLRIEPGQVVGLIGPNGAGKTTLIDALSGFLHPSSGAISLGDSRIDRWSAHRRARHGVSRTFQSLELFDDISVAENIRAACDTHSWQSWLLDPLIPRHERLTPIAATALRELGLADDLERKPSELPHGRRRLVAIARALASGPSVLLLDEPAAGLDEHESRELTTLIRRLADELGIGILVIEHDMALVMQICDTVTVLNFGQQIATGRPDEIRSNRDVVAAYLGEDPDQEPPTEPQPPAFQAQSREQ